MLSVFILFIILKETTLPEGFILIERQKGKDFFYDSLIIKVEKNDREILRAEYLRNKNKNVPLLIIFPILGPFDPSRFLTGIFMVHFKFKVDILILSQKRYIFWRKADSVKNTGDLIKIIKRMNENSYLRLRALGVLIDYLKEKGRAKKTGIIGISYGGIEGLVFALKYKRIDCIAIINAGGDIAGIITESVEPEIKKAIKKIRKKLKISNEELIHIISENLKDFEPLNTVFEIPGERILFVSSFGDRTVPYKYQKILWKHLNKPERVLLPYGHRGVIFYFFKILGEVFKMFDKNLN